MTKNGDSPRIAMRVEHGHLVPVSAFDLELMNQWYEGAIVSVTPERAQQRPLERRYFAMLSHLVTYSDTPWANVLTAHDALKMAAGFVQPYKKKNGTWGAHPRSITTFTDAELSEFFEVFCGIVRERFGIDPETLRKESPETESSALVAPYGVERDDGPGASPIPAGVGVPTSGAVTPAPDRPEAGGTLESNPRDVLSADGPLTQDDLDWLKQAARMLVAATAPGGDLLDAGTIDQQLVAIKQFLTPDGVSHRAKRLCAQIHAYCIEACIHKGPFDKKWIAHLAGCTVADLRPEAR